MASAGSLIFELAADVSRLRTDMGKAQAEIKSSLDSIAKSSAATAIMTGAQFALNFAKGFADKITAAIDQADAIGKLAQRIGTSTEAISGLNYAASFAGVSLDDLTAGLKGLNKALLETKDPASDATAAIQALGLNAAQLRSMDPAEAFNKIATALSGFKDGAEKAAVVQVLFGKQAQSLIPLLNQGAEGIAKFTDEAAKLGITISGETAQAMGDLNDDLARMKAAGDGMAATLARDLQPAISELVKVMREASTEGSPMNDVLHAIGVTAQKTIGIILAVIGTLQSLAATFSMLKKMAFIDLSEEGGWQKMKDTWNEGNQKVKEINEKYEASVEKIMHVQTQAEKVQNASAAALGALANQTNSANQKTLQFTDTKDKLAASLKKTKQAVDDYARMLESLQAQYRKLVAEGDPMKELLGDSKYHAMAEKQQATLRQWVQANIDAQRAIDATTSAKEAQQNANDFAYQQGAASLKQELDQADAMWDLVDATKAAVDPTIAYTKAVAELNSIQSQLSPEEYAKRMKQLSDDLAKAQNKMDPLAESLKSLQQAIEGFGKKASDALVDFMFSSEDASQSFSEMTASILKDLAKMLVYQNVMNPIFSSISKGVSGFDWASLFGGGRISGGPVSAGRMYQVNEIPGRTEYFLPNVPGRIVTDAGASNVGGGSNVTVNVHMMRDDRATQDTTAADRQTAELGNRIATVVRTVISQEKRTGGLLAPTR
ncbi:phage tail tape measure C-terminal domain-containing protein [Caballeronia cordobensis]|uniref:phage tail tape measure C-terminal domain-containing protein n=1 Tax=Caballeronia cordobensis TaxID=1353886 RepID=UPI00045EFD77|nr:uncharacterized protein BRPE67_BCDS11050 [Burkholderia sp. RPE67]